jgi:hypothetical protein
MKNVKSLKVKCTYIVELEDVEIPEDILVGIQKLEGKVTNYGDEREDYEEVGFQWLNDNIEEHTCCDFSYSVEKIIME